MKCGNARTKTTATGVRVISLAIATCLLSICVPVFADSGADFDGDGVPDVQDKDQDNDGLLNVEEGYQSVAAGELSVAPDYQYRANGIEVGADGTTARYSLTHQSAQYWWHGSAVNSASDVSWSDHGDLVKIQNLGPGVSTILWSLHRDDLSVPINMDLAVSDLDVERLETVMLEASMIVGYTLSPATTVDVEFTADGMIRFAAARRGDEADASVVLHIRDRDSVVIGYSSQQSDVSSVGLRAGFRHDFISGINGSYHPVNKAQDSDGDGSPDHRDTDSNNDGRLDAIDSGLVSEAEALADIVVDAEGVPLTAPDASQPQQPLPPVQTPETHDSDGDGLSDSQEQLLGTNVSLSDTDNDGFTDAEEVMVFHTDPVDINSTPLSADHDSADDDSADSHHAAVEPSAIDSDGDGIADSAETIDDTDADSLPNQFDLDSDNDGLPDVLEAGLPDSNADGLIDAESQELLVHVDQLRDTDNDGSPDFLDLDSDGDGKNDRIESGFIDADENGTSDNLIDTNHNGWDDDAEFGNVLPPDSDADSVPDYLSADPNLTLAAALQDDQPADTGSGDTLLTGVKGAGCSMTTNTKDYSLLLLLLLATLMSVRRRLRA
jgi:hypothetical protein